MGLLFAITNDDGKIIHLYNKQWKHISFRHPEMANKMHLIEHTLKYPDYKIENENKKKQYYKHIKNNNKYIVVIFRLLNKHGFVITSFLTSKIKR